MARTGSLDNGNLVSKPIGKISSTSKTRTADSKADRQAKMTRVRAKVDNEANRVVSAAEDEIPKIPASARSTSVL